MLLGLLVIIIVNILHSFRRRAILSRGFVVSRHYEHYSIVSKF